MHVLLQVIRFPDCRVDPEHEAARGAMSPPPLAGGGWEGVRRWLGEHALQLNRRSYPTPALPGKRGGSLPSHLRTAI
jgi:hypothetical protein